MRDRKVVWAALAGALVGCAAQQITSLVAPPVSAQQLAEMPRWQYQCFEARNLEDSEKALNEAGNERWELVSAMVDSDYIFCLKRPRR